jgi:hypothetical protein
MRRARLADAELAAQCEDLAVGGGERGLERGDLVAAAALLVGQLSGELADDDRLTATRWSAPWRGAGALSMRPISNAYTADEPVWSQSARQWRHVLPWSTCTSMILGGRPSTTSASMLLPSRGPSARVAVIVAPVSWSVAGPDRRGLMTAPQEGARSAAASEDPLRRCRGAARYAGRARRP